MRCIIRCFLLFRSEYLQPGGASEAQNESPLLDASLPSMLFFSWFTPLFWSGLKTSLKSDDLYELPPWVKSESIVPRFLQEWDSSHKLVKQKNPVESQPIRQKIPTESIISNGKKGIKSELYGDVNESLQNKIVNQSINVQGMTKSSLRKESMNLNYLIILQSSISLKLFSYHN